MDANLTFNISAETIDTLIDCAGYQIGYWAESATETDNGVWLYKVSEDNGTEFDGQTLTLDQKAVERGLAVLKDKYEWHFANIINGDTDAETGDVFVQACVFGDIIFG